MFARSDGRASRATTLDLLSGTQRGMTGRLSAMVRLKSNTVGFPAEILFSYKKIGVLGLDKLSGSILRCGFYGNMPNISLILIRDSNLLELLPWTLIR